MGWTNEQTDAIYKKGSNMLVAAAAGSGKTAVLVERIIQKILNDKVDIDKLLVVTFTNAAASEMRERVLEAIYKKLDEDPNDLNLKNQIVLLGKSNICTIHSFCIDVIRNNFFETNLSANFRISSEEEIEILKQEIIDDLFDELYEIDEEKFFKVVDTYATYRGDDKLKDMILNIYRFMQSSPFPKKWLTDKVNMFKEDINDKDFLDSVWGQIIAKDIKEIIIDARNNLKSALSKLVRFQNLDAYARVIENDIEMLKTLYEKLDKSWDETYLYYTQSLDFIDWPRKKVDEVEIKEDAKAVRDAVKKKLQKIPNKGLIYNSEECYKDIYYMYDILNEIKDIIFKFDELFKAKKIERNIVDFNDIEHYALEILVKDNGNGIYEPTEVAKRYQEKFVEIAIDEYQDSNQVQELILSSVSRNNNIFMVGDVKQSIYKFRQACPDLFLDKYNRYSLNNPNSDGLKIQLFKNFRSRQNVLDVTNQIFKSIMTKELGQIDYTEEEYLNLGAIYSEDIDKEKIAELDIIDLAEDERIDAWKNEEIEENEEFDESIEDLRLDKEEIEAKFVANKIKELLSSKMKVFDKAKGEREITYKDIVILLRSTSRFAQIYEKELSNLDIPVYSDSSSEYLDAIEIQTIISLLKLIDNPRDDLSLVAVLRSELVGFSDNEIIKIRLCEKNGSFYDAFIKAQDLLTGDLKDRLNNFADKIVLWREQSEYLSLAELIWKIYTETGFYNYVGLMNNGSLRQANLKMLFERAKEYEKTSFKGLFNFIRFIEKLKSGNTDMQAAKIIGENENVVRIMSIHKSKGLEFPVVFLASTSKKINMQDLTQNILLHQNLGLGPQYINVDKKVKYSTSAKEAIKIVTEEETISEEMRILYVALTRAREKLFITGISKDYEKSIIDKKEILNIYGTENGKVNPILLKKYISYLDWIELVILANKDIQNLIKVNKIEVKDFISGNEEVKEDVIHYNFKKIDNKKYYDDIFSWRYDHIQATKMPLKTTVSKIKESNLNEVIDFSDLNRKEAKLEEVVPEFMRENDEVIISGARRGTIVHSFLERIDFSKKYDLNSLSELKFELITKKIFTKEELDLVNLNKIMKFLNSDIASIMKNAKKVYKEEPFCIRYPAKEIIKDAKDEEILVQGIIDLFSINQDDTITIVDYKTDFVENNDENILIDKYYKQLEIYAKAVNIAKDLKVKDVYIYSLFLDKLIKVNLTNI